MRRNAFGSGASPLTLLGELTSQCNNTRVVLCYVQPDPLAGFGEGKEVGRK